MGFSWKILAQKTLKNVAFVMTPGLVFEIVNNAAQLVPAEHTAYVQICLGLISYAIKNASENGAWKLLKK